MKKGEQAILTCAPEYAYGQSGSPPTIPPDSTLKFDVSLAHAFTQIQLLLQTIWTLDCLYLGGSH